MLLELECFANENDIPISTDPNLAKSKTKCLFVFGQKKNLVKPASLTLCGRVLPYVHQADHLGNMEQDAAVK